jgi:RND family efflux transporter MFP subunit
MGLCILLLVVSFFWLTMVLKSSCLAQPEVNSVTASPSVRGLIISDLRTTLSAELAATISEITVDMGGRFKAGQPLVRFSNDFYQAQYNKAQSELESAQQRHSANLKLRELRSIGELDVLQSASLVEQKKSELQLYHIQLQHCTVNAPFSGRVIERQVSPHQFVPEGTPLLDIIDDRNLSVQAFIPSGWIQTIKIGQRFRVHVDEMATSYSARITTLGARVDANSQTIELRATIEGPHPELLAGMSGNIIFSESAK